jgi:hypothetical protein
MRAGMRCAKFDKHDQNRRMGALAPKHSATVSIPPMWCSTSWPVNVNLPTGQHHDAGRTDVPSCADRRLCPLRPPPEDHPMERTQIFDIKGATRARRASSAETSMPGTAAACVMIVRMKDKSIANVAGPAPCLARFLPNSISRSRLRAGSFTPAELSLERRHHGSS